MNGHCFKMGNQLKQCEVKIVKFTHINRDKVDDILLMVFSYQFSCMKMVVFWFKSLLKFITKLKSTISHNTFR